MYLCSQNRFIRNFEGREVYSTLMSKKEFFARVDEAEREIAEGKGITFTNKAEMAPTA